MHRASQQACASTASNRSRTSTGAPAFIATPHRICSCTWPPPRWFQRASVASRPFRRCPQER
ncbi:hypothetical protein ACFQZ4_09370 [Catellatospora coxensis]